MPHAPCLAHPLIHLVPIYLCGNMACVHGIMSCALDVRLVVSRCPRVRFGRRATPHGERRGACGVARARTARRRRSAVSVRRDWKTELLQRKARRLSTFDISSSFVARDGPGCSAARGSPAQASLSAGRSVRRTCSLYSALDTRVTQGDSTCPNRTAHTTVRNVAPPN